MDTTATQTLKIAALNDAARQNAANYTATRGVMALSDITISDIFVAVQEVYHFYRRQRSIRGA